MLRTGTGSPLELGTKPKKLKLKKKMIFRIVGVRVGFLFGNNIIVSLTLRRVRKKKTVFEIHFY